MNSHSRKKIATEKELLTLGRETKLRLAEFEVRLSQEVDARTRAEADLVSLRGLLAEAHKRWDELEPNYQAALDAVTEVDAFVGRVCEILTIPKVIVADGADFRKVERYVEKAVSECNRLGILSANQANEISRLKLELSEEKKRNNSAEANAKLKLQNVRLVAERDEAVRKLDEHLNPRTPPKQSLIGAMAAAMATVPAK